MVGAVWVVELYEFDEAGFAVGGAAFVGEDLVGGEEGVRMVRLRPVVDERFVFFHRRIPSS